MVVVEGLDLEQNIKSMESIMDNNTLLTEFINENYCEELRNRGFSTYKENNFNWCKIIGGNIIQSIHFVRVYQMETIYYGFYPMYVRLFFPFTVKNENEAKNQVFDGESNYNAVTKNIPSYWPNPIKNNNKWIVDKFDKILDTVVYPRFERIFDAESCYQEIIKTRKEIYHYPFNIMELINDDYTNRFLLELICLNKTEELKKVFHTILLPQKEEIYKHCNDNPKLIMWQQRRMIIESIENGDMSIIETHISATEEINKQKLLRKTITTI